MTTVNIIYEIDSSNTKRVSVRTPAVGYIKEHFMKRVDGTLCDSIRVNALFESKEEMQEFAQQLAIIAHSLPNRI